MMATARDLLLEGGNRLKLGVFACNGLAGVGTTVPEQFRLTWPNSLDVAVTADALGFEAIVPYARFRALVDARHRSGFIFENFTWAAAVAARTTRAAVMSTVHVTNVHPILAAKAMTTIDHISDGRFALNIVCGWLKEEAEMFGTDAIGHDERYAYADEWISAIKRLWTEEDEFDVAGRFVTIKNGMSQPKPVQKPYPVLMNAATSVQGKEFVARHCDIAFVLNDDPDRMCAEAAEYRRIARDTQGRNVSVWSFCAIIQGQDDADAARIADRYVEHADQAYIDHYFASQPRILPPEEKERMKRMFATGGNGIKIIGGAETIANRMKQIQEAGIDGLLLTWVDYQKGIRRFDETVLPRLEALGLRESRL